MILKLSIVGLLIVLVVVLAITYYTQLEGFISSRTAAAVLATSGNLHFMCKPNVDIKGGAGNGKIYKVSRDNRNRSVISVSEMETATVLVSDCECLKLGVNSAADVMMCKPGTAAPRGAGTGTGTGTGTGAGAGTGTDGTGASTSADAAAAAAAAAVAAASAAAGVEIETELATAAPTSVQVPLSRHNRGTINNRLPSQSIKETNTSNMISKKDKMIVRREFSGSLLRVYASMPSLSDNESVVFWIISGNDGNSSSQVIWKPVFVTNDSTFLSAEIPEEKYKPYIKKTVYLVSRTGQSPDDADGTFIVPDPNPNSKPAVINPQVTLSDTGYTAMALNKKSNLLSDIQKIVHNEMLANRATDVSVKNAGSSKKKRSNRNSYSDSCDSDTQYDMSKYIKKDEIPCWGCSIDY